MSTEKPNGKTQVQNPVESSDSFGIPMFITQNLWSVALGKNAAPSGDVTARGR